jgi:UbiD family decarboxylase
LKIQGYDVKGVHMSPGGSSWLHGVVSIEKKTDKDPEKIFESMFAEVPALKHAVVVDSDVNPYDMDQVEWALSTRFHGDRDLIKYQDTYASRLDPSSNLENKLGCKLGFDATIPLDRSRVDFMKGVIPTSKQVRKALKARARR